MNPHLLVRSPRREELERLGYLFRNGWLPKRACYLGAVREQPVERFVGAVAWWPAGGMAKFRFAGQSAESRIEVAATLLQQAGADASRTGLRTLVHAEMIPEGHPRAEILRQCGFKPMVSERHFEIPCAEARMRVSDLIRQGRHLIPTTWRADPIRLHTPESALSLILDHHLMGEAEVRDGWRMDCPYGFDLDLSAILLEAGQVLGVVLIRRWNDMLSYEVRVVRPMPRLLRSMANICLLEHGLRQIDSHAGIRACRFRADELRHRETANLAFRTGGMELPRRHGYGKVITPSL